MESKEKESLQKIFELLEGVSTYKAKRLLNIALDIIDKHSVISLNNLRSQSNSEGQELF